MKASFGRRAKTLATGVAATALLLTVGLAAPGWAARSGAAPFVKPGGALSAKAKVSDGLQVPFSGRHSVFVQLSGSGAADAAAGASSTAAAKSAAQSRRAAITSAANAAFGTARGTDARATRLFTVTNAVPGFAVELDSAAVTALAARDDVVQITPLVPKTLENASTVQLTKAVNDWQAGNLGKGAKVGIIDTGIDYTHADFGGAGTTAAYQAAEAASAGPWTPNAKVVGGYDFVGDDYQPDATAADYQPVPDPDPNPLDCENHGTHVAGTIGGYGVNADGSTFRGDYAKLSSDDLYAMKVGPGMAPEASLYALKIFGCSGVTEDVIPALDWALDPNGDGDFSDHLDIVNLSLGSDYAPADDPENTVIDEVAAHGVLPVVAAGNAGDLTDAGGAPANAVRSVAVASSVDAYQLRDGLKVDAPADVAGVVAGQFSLAYPWATSAPVTGDVVASPADNPSGCATYNATDAAAIKGKVVWQEWDDNDATRACGSAARAANARVAGAVGAIFTSGLDVFSAGITGDAGIPVIQLPKTGTDKLRPALAAGTLRVTFDGSLAASIKDVTPGIVDTLSSFSSRGSHGSIGVVKPDLAAPGDTIASASMGSGSGALVESGTSMATPNVAGISALVKVAHPGWTTEQLKADLMNTAAHDVYSGDGQTGPIYGPNRAGSGRVDAQAAVQNDLLVYDKDVSGSVSASFGVVPVSITKRTQTFTRTLTVQNTGRSARVVSLSYDAITAQQGVSYSVSPRTLVVPGGRSATAVVTLTVTPSKLTKTLDPTEVLEDAGAGVPRQYVSDSSGRVLIQERGKTALRVPVYGAVKPTSATSTRLTSVTSGSGTSRTTTPALTINGTGFAQGAGNEAFTSLVSVLEYGASSPKLKPCTGSQIGGCTLIGSESSGDLRYVGAGGAEGWMYFGINTWGQWASLGHSVTPYVDIDTTGDGQPDYEVLVQDLPDSDVLASWLIDIPSGALLDLEPVNMNLGDVDTNVFDSDTMLIPIDPTLIGLSPGTTSFPITYQVSTVSSYTNAVIDSSSPVSYDVADPALSVAEPLYYDQGGTSIPFQLGSDATKDTKALVLHLQGAPGQRAEVVGVTASRHRPVPPGKKHGAGTWKPGGKVWRPPVVPRG